jgi:hypothetical protein
MKKAMDRIPLLIWSGYQDQGDAGSADGWLTMGIRQYVCKR